MKIRIYDPAMCCPTGVCGPAVDPVLVKMNETVLAFRKQGVDVKRYNLTQQPGEFMEENTVTALLKEGGKKVLPITLVNGELFMSGSYPSYEELCEKLGIEPVKIKPISLL